MSSKFMTGSPLRWRHSLLPPKMTQFRKEEKDVYEARELIGHYLFGLFPNRQSALNNTTNKEASKANGTNRRPNSTRSSQIPMPNI